MKIAGEQGSGGAGEQGRRGDYLQTCKLANLQTCRLAVTFLTGEYPPMQGGIADYTACLAGYLQGLGVVPSVLISEKYKQTLPKQANNIGEVVYRYPLEGEASLNVYPHLWGWGRRCWLDIWRFLRDYKPDILHIQYQAAAFDLGGWVNWLPWYLRLRGSPVKVVTTFHDLRIPYLFPKAGILRWWTVLALARYSDAVICTNAEDVKTLQNYPWGQHISEIPLGNNVAVNPPPDYDRQAWRHHLGVPDNALLLAYFGFLNESKGGEDLIATLDALISQGVNAYLLMIGGDVGDSDPNNAAYAQRVRTLIHQRNLDKRIIFTGYVDLPAVSANLLAADMAVMPYRDGVSFRRTTLIAALRHGLPVISTIPTLHPPQIIEGQNMRLVPPQDVPALVAAVLQVANNATLHQQLSHGAKALGQYFDWDKVAAQTTVVYNSTYQ